MINPMWAVIDKSFLQQANQNELNGIVDDGFHLLLTARTAYEINTTEKEGVRRKCLQILEFFKDNVDIIEEDGCNGLLGYEIKEKKPSNDVLQNYIRPLPVNIDHYLQNVNSSQWKDDLESGPAEEFEKIVSEMTNIIPSLNKDGLTSRNKVQDIYAKLMRSSPVYIIDEHWLIFRRIQVDC